MVDLRQLSSSVLDYSSIARRKYTTESQSIQFNTNTSPQSSGTLTALSSRLIPQTLFTAASSPALLNATLQMLSLSGGESAIYLNTPFNYPSNGSDTSASPAWRGAVWHILSQAEWEWDAGVDAAKAAYVKANAAMAPLRALTPGGGAYQVRSFRFVIVGVWLNGGFWGVE